MAKFIYLGKKQDFVLSSVYEYRKPLNNGDIFDLEGNDIALMKRCLDVAKKQGIEDKDMDFRLYSSYIAQKDMEEFNAIDIPEDTKEVEQEKPKSNKIFDNSDEIVEDEEEEVSVVLEDLKKNELLAICAEKGLDVKQPINKPELIELIKSN